MITLVKLYTVAFASVGCRGGLAFYLKNANYEKIRVRNSCTDSCNTTAITKWNKNWDYMEPETRVRPIDPNKTGDESRYKKEMSESITATRNLVLISRFEMDTKTNLYTDRGKRQAELTWERLKNLEIKWDKFVYLNILSNEIPKHFVDIIPTEIERCHTNETVKGEPRRSENTEKSYVVSSASHEAVFRRHFSREYPSVTQDTHYLIMLHPRNIRHLVLKALQLPTERWTRIVLHQGSITWISIPLDGHVQLRCFGDVQHLPPADWIPQ